MENYPSPEVFREAQQRQNDPNYYMRIGHTPEQAYMLGPDTKLSVDVSGSIDLGDIGSIGSEMIGDVVAEYVARELTNSIRQAPENTVN